MQRAIQNTQAATRRRSCPIRVAGSTLTANVAFAVLKYAALTAAGVLLFRWGQGYALAEGLNKAIFGEGEEPKGILAEAAAQAAHEKEQEDEDQKRADAVDMMKHIAAAFDIPATIGEGKQEEQEKEAKQLFGWYSELKKAGFTDAQAFELIKG